MARDKVDETTGSASVSRDGDAGPDAAAAGNVEGAGTEPTSDADNGSAPAAISEEAVVALIAERDEYLDALQRLKAEFANARRRSDEQAAATRRQAAADLVEKLLPVLDSCDAALAHGIDEVRPIRAALLDTLTGQGLERLDPVGEPFDPEHHDAVLYEEGETGQEQVVVETLRTGYRWNQRVLRAPMVKVQG